MPQAQPFIVTHFRTELNGRLEDSHVYLENTLVYRHHDKWRPPNVGGFDYFHAHTISRLSTSDTSGSVAMWLRLYWRATDQWDFWQQFERMVVTSWNVFSGRDLCAIETL
jgi:hypothetical protein